MTDFIKKLEKEFDIQIICSKEHIWENYYDVDKDGKIITLFLRYVDLNKLDVLLPRFAKSPDFEQYQAKTIFLKFIPFLRVIRT